MTMDCDRHSEDFGLVMPSASGTHGSAYGGDAVAFTGTAARPRRGSWGIAVLDDGQREEPCTQCCSRRKEAFSPRVPQQGSPVLTLPLLKNFDSVAEFLLRFERVTEYWKCDDRGKVLFLEEAVEGSHVQKWFANYLKFYGHHTYKNVELNLRRAFCDKYEYRKYKLLLEKRSWEEKESFREYFWDKCILMQNYSQNLELWEKIDFIKKGMPVSWQSKLVGETFQDLGEMFDRLVCMESDLIHMNGSALLPDGEVTSPSPEAVDESGLSVLTQMKDALSSLTQAIASGARESGSRQDLPLRPYSQGGEPKDCSRSSRSSYRASRDHSSHRRYSPARVRDTVFVRVSRSRSSSRDRGRMSRWRDGGSRSRSRSRERDYRMDSRDREGRGQSHRDRGDGPKEPTPQKETGTDSKNELA